MSKTIPYGTPEWERLNDEENRRQSRLQEQEDKKDYSYQEDGSKEKCEDCGAIINSHGHCPNCDY